MHQHKDKHQQSATDDLSKGFASASTHRIAIIPTYWICRSALLLNNLEMITKNLWITISMVFIICWRNPSRFSETSPCSHMDNMLSCGHSSDLARSVGWPLWGLLHQQSWWSICTSRSRHPYKPTSGDIHSHQFTVRQFWWIISSVSTYTHTQYSCSKEHKEKDGWRIFKFILLTFYAIQEILCY